MSIGIDMGQKRDPTAIAVAKLEERHGGTYHVIRLLERLPLRTPYPEIAQRLATIVGNLQARMQQDEAERQLLLRPLLRRPGWPPAQSGREPPAQQCHPHHRAGPTAGRAAGAGI